MTRTPMTKFAFAAYFTVTVALLIASVDLAAAPRSAMTTAMQPAADSTPNGAAPSPNEVLQPEDHAYRPVRLEVRKIVWFEPGQRGLIEAHPLVMGLAAMALATVTLLFFFLRGVKRPKGGDI